MRKPLNSKGIKVFMKPILLIFIVIIITGCEPWILLRPTPTSSENKLIEASNEDYILKSDSIIVNCIALFPENDSTSKYIVVTILTDRENLKWENINSYLLVDIYNNSLKPSRIKKYSNNSSVRRLRYEITFGSNEKIKSPLSFNFNSLNQKEYSLTFSW